MQLRIRAQHLDVPADTRLAIGRKVRLALGRHAARIDLAQITLSPSLQGSPGNRCRIRVRLHQGESLAIEDCAEDLHAAAAAAARRLQRRLERQRAAQPVGPSEPRRLGVR